MWHELLYGAFRLPVSRPRRALERYLNEVVAAALPILTYDAAAAAWHARERARLERRGKPAPFVEGQIAAIARVHDLALVTSNVEDLRAYEGLKVVDWSRSKA